MDKITYIIDNLYVGGAQSHLLKLIKEIRSKGYAVDIFCLGGIHADFVQDGNDMVIHFLKMDYVWHLYFWKNFYTLIKLLSKIKPTIVHTYLDTANVFGVLAARLAKVPVIISSRRDAGHFRSQLIAKLEIFTARLGDGVVCVSGAIKDIVVKRERLSPSKVVVIYNGVNSDVFEKKNGVSSGRGGFVVTMVASIDRRLKGHSYFIDAAARVLEKRKDVRFVLIGDGPLRNPIEKLIDEKGIKEYFELRGRCTQLNEELKTTDLLVVPSESEGCSNALLEAMAMGIPAIATAIEGNLEVIKDDVCGFLVRVKDPQAIAKKILELVASPERLKEAGRAARERIIEKFTLKDMVSHYIKFYESLLESKGLKKRGDSKIGYVVSLFPCWSETFILNEMVELTKKGFEISIFSIRRDFEEFTQDKARSFIKNTNYINLPKAIIATLSWLVRRPVLFFYLLFLILNQRYTSFKKLIRNLYAFFAGCHFASITQKEHLTHIHAHFATYPALVALVISKLTKIPYTFTVHAHDIFLDKTLLKEKIKAAKAIIAISDYNKHYISEYCQNGIDSKVNVIHCGLDLTEFANLNVKHKENMILSVGRLTKMKGFEYLIKACSWLKNQIPIQCRIIGDGPLRDELEKLIISSGLRDIVTIEGVIDNNKIKHLLDDCAVFVLSSVWDEQDGQDGIPLVLVESMAQGVPVISSRISGIPELVIDGETGLLVEPGNGEQLSQKILQLLNDKELQAHLAEAGRRKVEEEFDVVKSVEKLIQVFSS